VKIVKSFLHRRTNQGGHAGKGEGEKRSLAFAVSKFMRRRFLYALEALSNDNDLLKQMWVKFKQYLTITINY
jgi:hypothetical protein